MTLSGSIITSETGTVSRTSEHVANISRTNSLIDEPKRSENKGVTPFIPYSCYEKIDRSKLTGFEALNYQPPKVSPMLQWLNENWLR